jgi:hypothetical protein
MVAGDDKDAECLGCSRRRGGRKMIEDWGGHCDRVLR